ncbi:hypothetical protein CBR_g34204 [Chara braunii]|uniref:Protein kinase domain-containing protein n=1 Tax=Chara braunii TaxID=69332 RepID=A0A388LI67_CHABU|nr:hypothetical protein CBR_g34204 [Chara braunii]|eukprot:GBG82024.1 hypothetical protein CBR_g34204 [Chara braunii]
MASARLFLLVLGGTVCFLLLTLLCDSVLASKESKNESDKDEYGNYSTSPVSQQSQTPASSPSSSARPESDKRTVNMWKLALGVAGGVLITLLCVLGLWVMMRRKKMKTKKKESAGNTTMLDQEDTQSSDPKTKSSLSVLVSGGSSVSTGASAYGPISLEGIREIPLAEIKAATKNFSPQYLLAGKGGGFGEVYRAFMIVGGKSTEVAIKVMKGKLDDHNYRQFLAEIQILSQVRHRNLCMLLGYCIEEERCILLYPFITGGSLYDRLYGDEEVTTTAKQQNRQVTAPSVSVAEGDAEGGRKMREPLTWQERMSTAQQVATGLRYLHHEASTAILHRDIKSRNLLIEGKGKHLRAYVIDFGLAKPGAAGSEQGKTVQISGSQTILTLGVWGTPGYIAPEYAHQMHLTTKNDVYAFGVVLLELVTGKRAVLIMEEGVWVTLVAWWRQWVTNGTLTKENLAEITDPRISQNLSKQEWEMVHRFAMLAHRCTSDLSYQRPSMVEVMEEIGGILKESQPAPNRRPKGEATTPTSPSASP